MPVTSKKIDELAINTIRFLAVDGVQKANSGHPGMPMGCAPIGYMLYAKLMNHNPSNPKWLNRDRFILSAGHGSMLLYSLLHLCGYGVSLDELKKFRTYGSITPGHPEFGLTPGVETTTGPLGQGFANAVGMAIAQEYLASMFNKGKHKILDHYIYGICSDGDLMEGVSHEAASLAGHLKLSKLIFFYDDNKITIDGSTSLAFSEDVGQRFDAYGWQVLRITNVNELSQIEDAVNKAKAETKKPTLIITKTNIGYGSPNKQDTSEAHGSPLGDEEIRLTKKKLGWPEDLSFHIPEEIFEMFTKVKDEGEQKEKAWKELFNEYKKEFPDDASKFISYMNNDFGNEWESALPVFEDDGKKLATRAASGKVLNSIASKLPTLIGGSADLAPSNNTFIKGFGEFSAENRSGRNFHFGIREHGMASIMNGMAIYGGVIPYGGTFLIFSDYLRPAIRLASLSHVKPIYVLTHDSIGLGEDGPTHQPVEHLASLRAIPGNLVIRPADANETAEAWKAALNHKNGPVGLILTRQGLPVLDQKKYKSAANLHKGAYVLYETSSEPDIILIASGSEIGVTLKAVPLLEEKDINVRVVSFPSWGLFEKQNADYKESVLPHKIKARVVIEAGVKQGWEKYAGESGEIISIEKFGASAPVEVIFDKYNFNPGYISETAFKVVEKLKKLGKNI
ncbi:MAG: transketolase [Ignavibacteriales bacterium]|nr:MAG: transketolase [Ignavibacteriales bacterium]